MLISDHRQTIRKTVRTRRKSLSLQDQQIAATELLSQFQNFIISNPVRRIAIYLAFDGEICTRPLIEWCWQQGIEVSLPILHPEREGHLLFMPYCAQTPMVKNRFGIDEPVLNQDSCWDQETIDMIFTPLVAFDDQGNRLGMGGGFYDRTLENWHQHHRPLPVGLAHDCQQYDNIPIEAWDIPLPFILTPTRCWHWPTQLAKEKR